MANSCSPRTRRERRWAPARELAALRARVAAEEARLREAEERARLEAALLVARTVAHELNNALSPVVGYAELLSLDPAVARSPTAAQFVALVAEGAADAVRRVERLQQVARLGTAPTTMTPSGAVLDLTAAPAHADPPHRAAEDR